MLGNVFTKNLLCYSNRQNRGEPRPSHSYCLPRQATRHQHRDSSVLPQARLLSLNEPLRGEPHGEHLCRLPLVLGTGARLSCLGGRMQHQQACGAREPSVSAERSGRQVRGGPGWEWTQTPLHCESLATNRLIHNLWSQRKSLLLIIIIRHND